MFKRIELGLRKSEARELAGPGETACGFSWVPAVRTSEHPDGERVYCSLIDDHSAERHVHVYEPSTRSEARMERKVGASISLVARGYESKELLDGFYVIPAKR